MDSEKKRNVHAAANERKVYYTQLSVVNDSHVLRATSTFLSSYLSLKLHPILRLFLYRTRLMMVDI